MNDKMLSVKKMMLALAAVTGCFLFTSCDAVLGGEVTFKYGLFSLIIGSIGTIISWDLILGIVSFDGYNALYEEKLRDDLWGWQLLISIVLFVLGFLWAPFGKFPLVLQAVDIGIAVVFHNKIKKAEFKTYSEFKKRDEEYQKRENQRKQQQAAAAAQKKQAEINAVKAEITRLEKEINQKKTKSKALSVDAADIMKKASLNKEIKALEEQLAKQKSALAVLLPPPPQQKK